MSLIRASKITSTLDMFLSDSLENQAYQIYHMKKMEKTI